MSITAANILLALEVVSQLAGRSQQVIELISKAQSEGRDITPEELDEIKAAAKSALGSLEGALDK